jgi:hypothetical protein
MIAWGEAVLLPHTIEDIELVIAATEKVDLEMRANNP